jgi:hypothetical protein
LLGEQRQCGGKERSKAHKAILYDAGVGCIRLRPEVRDHLALDQFTRLV